MALTLTQRFRRQVAPYDIVQSLAVSDSANYCPALQTYRAGVPNVDRASAPTLIVATISASSKDGSGSVASAADPAVTNVKWMAQRGDESAPTDITLHPDWAGGFSIGSGADQGKLTVSMNVPAGTRWLIWMECDIADQRRGYAVPIHVVTDTVLLYSIADSDDQYTMSIDRPSAEIYEPARDARLIHDYLIGKGEAHTLVDDGNTYERSVTATLRQGGLPVAAADYTVKAYAIDSLGTRSEATAANDDCITSISGQTVSFDLRFGESRTYQIACLVDGAEVACKTYGWAWSEEMPTTDEGIVGGATYIDGERQTYRPKLNLGKGMLMHPTVAYDLRWHYQRPGSGVLTYVGSGEQHTYDLANEAMFAAGEADAVLTIDKRGAYEYLEDSSGDRYTDENGEYLIEH